MMVFFRRSSAVTFAPVIIALQLFCLLQRGTPWLGEWDWTLDWAGGATVLMGPLLASCAAFEVLRWRERSTAMLLSSTPRGAYGGWLGVASVLAVGAAVHTAATVAALLATAAVGAEPSASGAMSLVLPLAVLTTCAFIGGALASAWPSLFAVPAAGAITFGITAFASDLMLPDVLTVGGSTGSLVGLTWDQDQQWSALAVMLALIIVLAVLMRAHDSVISSRWSHLVVVVALAALAAAVVNSRAAPTDRLRVSHAHIDYDCAAAGDSMVCLASQTSRQLDWLARQVAEQSAPLAAIGVSLPHRFQQLIPYRRLPTGSAPVILSPDTVNSRSADPERIGNLLATPALCPADTTEVSPPEQVFAARAMISAWISEQNGYGPGELDAHVFGDWLKQPEAGQGEWVATTFDQLRDCRYGDVQLPATVVLP